VAQRVDMVGVRADLAGGRTPFDCWRHVPRVPVDPMGVRRAEFDPGKVSEWFVEHLAKLHVGTELFVAPSGVGFLPWFVFRLPSGPAGLARCFRSLSVRAMLVADGRQCLSFHMGEHACTAKVFDLAAVAVSGGTDAEPGSVLPSGGS
jgi:hypothetical protein